MTIERTYDWELVKSIITHVRVYPHVSDDYSPSPQDYLPLQHDCLIYLLASEEQALGLWMLQPENRILYKVHTCILPVAYGETADMAVRLAMKWVWSNTECLRVITEVPRYNRLALKFALKSGMVEYGVNPGSLMKNGKLEDLILLGISKPEGN